MRRSCGEGGRGRKRAGREDEGRREREGRGERRGEGENARKRARERVGKQRVLEGLGFRV